MINMLTITTRMTKSFTTFFAFIWLLTRVESGMLGQVMLVFEAFSAGGAFVGSFSGVFVHVALEGRVFGEFFGADGAFVHLGG